MNTGADLARVRFVCWSAFLLFRSLILTQGSLAEFQKISRGKISRFSTSFKLQSKTKMLQWSTCIRCNHFVGINGFISSNEFTAKRSVRHYSFARQWCKCQSVRKRVYFNVLWYPSSFALMIEIEVKLFSFSLLYFSEKTDVGSAILCTSRMRNF